MNTDFNSVGRITKEEIQGITNRCMHGRWYGEGKMEDPTKTIKVNIVINENVLIEMCIDKIPGKVELFPSASVWKEQFLIFTANTRFFTCYAHEHYMLFGELEKPGDIHGKNKWLLKLERVL